MRKHSRPVDPNIDEIVVIDGHMAFDVMREEDEMLRLQIGTKRKRRGKNRRGHQGNQHSSKFWSSKKRFKKEDENHQERR